MYAPYIPAQQVIEILTPIIAIGSVDTSRLTPNAGGYVLSYEQLNNLQLQAESLVFAKLRKYYKYPLETVDGITDFTLFDDLTRGTLMFYLLSATCEMVASYAITSAGLVKARTIYETYLEKRKQAEEVFFALDAGKGQIYPALDTLKYSHHYIPRQQNPIIQSKAPDTRYSVWINYGTNIGAKWI